jgi:hypothetical protein
MIKLVEKAVESSFPMGLIEKLSNRRFVIDQRYSFLILRL